MHRTAKPVRKCNGCGLNMRDRCGAFDAPHSMWDRHGGCPGYQNGQLLAEFEAAQAAQQTKEARERRREVAQTRREVPHQNGDRHVLMTAVKR